MIEDIEDIGRTEIAEGGRERREDFKLKHKQRKVKGIQRKQQLQQENDEGSDCEVQFVTPNLPGAQSIFVKTYGCSHNISDSEFMMGQLVEYGYRLADSIQTADCILINSCTVKNPSQQSFIGLVQQAKQMHKPVVVAGCVPQGQRDIEEIDDVSIVGITQIDRVVEVVEETLKGNKVQLLTKKELPSLDLPKIRKNKFIEIVPVNGGCLGACTYCKTKHARGKLCKIEDQSLVSYQVEALQRRINTVIKEGVKQIWLTSEDTGAYGRDIGTNISVLLKGLVEQLPEDVMLRIGMTNPPYILEHLHNISMILNHPRVFAFLHIPVQSGSNAVLERMVREYTREEFETVCDHLIKHVPGITLATDIICGFPGETEEQFEETMTLIDKYKFRVLNISQFYPRPGTAAEKMKKCNTKDVKARSQRLTKLFDTFDRWSHLLGTEQLVWIHEKEEKHGEVILIGHTKQYSKVVFPYDPLLFGQTVKIKVTKVLTWHIEGDIIERRPKFEAVPENYWDDFQHIHISNLESKVQRILKEQDEEEEKTVPPKQAEDQCGENGCCGSDGCGSNGCGSSGTCGTGPSSQGGCCGTKSNNTDQGSKKKNCGGICNGNCKCSTKQEVTQTKQASQPSQSSNLFQNFYVQFVIVVILAFGLKEILKAI